MRRGIALLAASALAGGCGLGETETGEESGSARVTMVVTVVDDEGAAPRTMHLTCDPESGDHPNVEGACAAIDAADASVFEPVPADRPCTMIYGGPQTAKIDGSIDGREVKADFSRSGGCEIDRWDTLQELFAVPLQ